MALFHGVDIKQCAETFGVCVLLGWTLSGGPLTIVQIILLYRERRRNDRHGS